jgi:hypothetical protein
MAANDGTETVADDELLYRRIPVSMGWYSGGELSPEAFDPRPNDRPDPDLTGISVSRAKYKTIQEAARGSGRKGYYVAVLRAGDLRNNGIAVEQRPRPGDPGHAELPDLRSDNRNAPETKERKLWLANHCLRIEGPFGSTSD